MRLVISRLTEDQINEGYLATLNDSSYMQFSRHNNTVNTIESQRNYLNGFDFLSNFLLAIRDQDRNQLVATATLNVLPGNQVVSIGFLVIKNFSAQGLGKEILRTLSDWVFELFPMMSQQIGTRHENIAMQKIALSSQFYEAARFRTEEHVYFIKEPNSLPEFLKPGNSEFHIVCHDTGGAFHISALSEALCLNATATLSGPAKDIFNSFCPSIPVMDIDLNLIANKKFLLGSGFYGGIESKILERGIFNANQKIVLLDHWVNYKERFSSIPQELPDIFLVTNRQAETRARESFPQSLIQRIPDFLLAVQKTNYLSREAAPESILFLLEPDALMGEGLMYRIGDIQQYVPVILSYLRSNNISKVVIRRHPGQEYLLDFKLVDLPNDIQVSYSENESLVDDLLRSRAVFGFHSSALYASAMLGIETFSFFAGSTGHWTTRFTEISKVN